MNIQSLSGDVWSPSSLTMIFQSIFWTIRFRKSTGPGLTQSGVHGALAPGAVADGPPGVRRGLGVWPLHDGQPPLPLNLSLKYWSPIRFTMSWYFEDEWRLMSFYMKRKMFTGHLYQIWLRPWALNQISYLLFVFCFTNHIHQSLSKISKCAEVDRETFNSG